MNGYRASDDPSSTAALAIEAALTPAERGALTAAFFRLNAAWRGAKVADILWALYQTDAHLDVIEPLLWRGDDEPWLTAQAAYAAMYMTPRPPGVKATTEAVRPIAEGIIERVKASRA